MIQSSFIAYQTSVSNRDEISSVINKFCSNEKLKSKHFELQKTFVILDIFKRLTCN